MVRMSCGALTGSSADVKAYEAADVARAEAEREWVPEQEGWDRAKAEVEAAAAALRPTGGGGSGAPGVHPGLELQRGGAAARLRGDCAARASPGRQAWAGSARARAGFGASSSALSRSSGSSTHHHTKSDPGSAAARGSVLAGRAGAKLAARTAIAAAVAGAPDAYRSLSVSTDIQREAAPSRLQRLASVSGGSSSTGAGRMRASAVGAGLLQQPRSRLRPGSTVHPAVHTAARSADGPAASASGPSAAAARPAATPNPPAAGARPLLSGSNTLPPLGRGVVALTAPSAGSASSASTSASTSSSAAKQRTTNLGPGHRRTSRAGQR